VGTQRPLLLASYLVPNEPPLNLPPTPCQVLRSLLLGAGQIPRGCQVSARVRLGMGSVRPDPPPVPWCVPRNGIYPLMNFAAARPLGLPRVLAPPPEEAQKAKTPTPEPFDSETRKVSPYSCCTVLTLRHVHTPIAGTFLWESASSNPSSPPGCQRPDLQ
jgi:hypothetical protein